jgi:hypothetical protein
MKYLNLFVEHAIEGEKDLAVAALRKVIAEKSARMINEDHEEVMSTKEMVARIKSLFKKADGDKKVKFLSKLAKAAGVKECSEKDIGACAKNLCAKGKEQCDAVIHALEKLVGVTFKKPVKEGCDNDEDKKGNSKKKDDEDDSEEDEDESEDDEKDDDDDSEEDEDESEDDEKDEKKGKKDFFKKSKKKDDDSDDSDDDKKEDKKDFFKKFKK